MKNINIQKTIITIILSIATLFCLYTIFSNLNIPHKKITNKINETITTENNNENQKINNVITEENSEKKEETFFEIFQYGDEIEDWMINNEDILLEEYTYYPITITTKSNKDFYKINNVGVGNTLKEVQEAMKNYEPFYSIHTPNRANDGWYYLNDEGNIIIFDFVEDDLSYVSENITLEETVKSIIITNLIFFD